MKRGYLVTCLVGLLLGLGSRLFAGRAIEAPVPDMAVSSGNWSDATGASSAGVAAAFGARPRWRAEGDLAGAFFGSSLGTAGDVNGDGYDDVIVGAYEYNSEGRAFVYHGSASGLSIAADWTADGGQEYAGFGTSVRTAGDVNHDGYDDVIVGAWRYENGEGSEGGAFAYYGSALGLSLSPDWAAEGNQYGALFGISVSTAGDVNGDGYDDVIVGSREYDNLQKNEGRAFVYYGSATGLSHTPDWTAEIDQEGARFGAFVSAAGDVNGDGYDDVIVGAWNYHMGQRREGGAFVYHGSASGPSSTPDWKIEGNQDYAELGSVVGLAGDVNGDGYDDVIVGAPLYDNGQTDEGRALVFYGSPSGLSKTPDWTAEGDVARATFGSVGPAGDVNGDGYDDVIVGANGYENGQSLEGGIFVYQGSASGLSTKPAWTAESNQDEAHLGVAVGTAGDVNGDGYDEVIAGASYYDHGQNNEGAAVVFGGLRP